MNRRRRNVGLEDSFGCQINIEAKLLKREVQKEDCRAYKASLTDYSKNIVNELEELAQCTNEQALNGISLEERENVIYILKHIIVIGIQ